jgi:ribose transport system ATP-binding protein
MQRRPWTLPVARLRQAALRAIAQLGIKATGPDQPVASLSGGNQQKVVIGKWLALQPDILLLSDPTKGVDVHARTEIYSLLDQLAQGGSAILVYASDLQELLLHCDRILVMYEGRIAGELSGATMNEQDAMAASFGRAA